MEGPLPLNTDENDNLNFSSMSCPITNSQLNELQRVINPLAESTNYGIELYLHALAVVQFMISENVQQ